MTTALQPSGRSGGDAPPSADPAPADSDAEGWALLDGLRRRLDDLGTQTRKTGTQVGQLAASIAAMVDAQRKRSRWLNINSFVAYVIFTLLCGGAFYFLYQSRTRELVNARNRAAAERDAAAKRADAATAALAAHEAANAKMAAAARIAQSNREQWQPILTAANAAYKLGRYNEVLTTLDQARGRIGATTADAHYLMGLAAVKAEQFANAVTHLRTAISSEVAQEDARFQLATALDRAGHKATARLEYDRFVAEHPQSPSAAVAQRRSAALAHNPSPPIRQPAQALSTTESAALPE